MSLFLKLQLAIAGVLLLTVAGTLAAYELAAHRAATERALDAARTHGATLAQTLEIDGASLNGDAAARSPVDAQLARLIATGRLMAASVIGLDGRAVMQAAVPGLEEFEVSTYLSSERLRRLTAHPWVNAEVLEDAVVVAAPLLDTQGRLIGTLGLSLPVEMLLGEVRDLLIFGIAAALVAAGIGIVTAAAIARGLTRPIDALAQAAARAGEGRAEIGDFEVLGRRTDEVGRLARAMLRLVRTLTHVTERTEQVLEERLRELVAGRER